MKALYLLSLLAALPTPAQAEIEDCQYDARGGDFIVIAGGSRKVKFVDRDFANAALACSWNYAALYDGDDLYVYDAKKDKFEVSFMPDDNYQNGVIATGANGILFYDGDDLYSYCGGKFDRNMMVDDNAVARASGNGRTASMWIGDDNFALERDCRIVKR
jgi:hypothetical protein